MTQLELRLHLANTAKSWLGANERDGSFKPIIDLYNTQRPLPRGYPLQYDDEWCAGYVTAVGLKAGLSEIILGECSCGKMIELYRAKGLWQEDDAYVPRVGDLIIYNWKDGPNYATTDCKTGASHVGIVVGVKGNTITVIEGNKNELVGYRNLQVNGRYIRGYCLPNYASLATQPEEEKEDTMDNYYDYLKDVPPSYRPTVRKVMEKGYLGGYSDKDPSTLEDNYIHVSETFCRVMVVMDRAGALD